MKALTTKAATPSDAEWVWHLYKSELQEAVDKQWGWNESFQKSSFEKNLPIDKFNIVSQGGEPVAALIAEQDETHLELKMLLVVPTHQMQGIGRWCVEQLQNDAIEMNLPIKLSVINANHVHEFYEKTGFGVNKKEADKTEYIWTQ